MPTRDLAWMEWSAAQQGTDSEYTAEDIFKAGWQSLIDHLGGHFHIARIGESDLTVQHPVEERLVGGLLDCQMHKLISVAAEEGHLEPGEYHFEMDRGVLTWERVK